MMTRGVYQLMAANTPPAGGIWPLVLPENPTLPARTYQIVGGSSEPTFGTSGMQKVRVQFDDWANDPDAAADGRARLRTLLEGFHGRLPDGSFLDNAEWVQDVDFFESDPRQYRYMSEFYFYFTLP